MAKRALVVGINNYQNPRNNLPSCLNDAADMRDFLQQKFQFEISDFLRNQAAGKDAILAGVKKLLAGVSPGDECIFYFSGHGYSFQDGSNWIEALVPQDARFLTSDDLAAITIGLPPGSLTVVLDSCHSGGMQKGFLPGAGAEALQVKFWTPSDATVKDFIPPEQPFFKYRAFGSPEKPIAQTPVVGAAPPPDKAFIVDDTNGGNRQFILISACQANETAAASTSQTNGRSAFTFSFLQQFAAAGTPGAIEHLLENTGKALEKLGVTQTPVLKVPDRPSGLTNCAFLSWSSPLPTPGVPSKPATPQPSIGIPAPKAPSNSLEQKEFSMSDTTTFDKNWLSDIGPIVQSVTPLIVSSLSGGSKGFDATPTKVDKAWFDTLARTVATVLPAVVQGLRTTPPPSKDFVAGSAAEFDKGWFDSITSVAAAVIPHVIVALKTNQQSSLADLSAAAQKGWFDDVTHVVAHVLPVVIQTVQQSRSGAPAKDFQPVTVDDKGFFDTIGEIAKVAVPIALPLLL